MQEANTNLLSGAALALDEDGDIGLRHPLELIPDGLHCSSLSENNV